MGRTRFIGILAALATLAGGPLWANDRQNEIKAAFIFNFARFTDWPADRFTNQRDNIRVCYDQGHYLAEALQTIDGKSIGNRSIRLVSHPGALAQSDCHILVLMPGETAQPRHGVLTVGENADFIERGGAIALVQIGRQVRFQINQRNIQQAQLRMSSKLMRLATRVVK